MLKKPQKRHVASYQSLRTLSKADLNTHQLITQRVANLLGLDLITKPESLTKAAQAECYYIPDQTLLQDEAISLEIYNSRDLYGGVVPYEFLKHKTLSHPIYHPSMRRPEGWNNQLGGKLKPYVLNGYSAFNTQDILWTAQDMIHRSPIRLKSANANGCHNQWVFTNYTELTQFMNQPQYQPLFEQGAVIEENINHAKTFSIGQTEIGNLLISYCGEQVLTPALSGEYTYGGTTLFVVRGDYNRLHEALSLPIHREALSLARQYEQLIFETFPLIYASRRNYDVLYGINSERQTQLGVLEQSWRMGGASMAELLALESFSANPRLKTICAWTREYHTKNIESLANKESVYYVGENPNGFIVKYAGVSENLSKGDAKNEASTSNPLSNFR